MSQRYRGHLHSALRNLDWVKNISAPYWSAKTYVVLTIPFSTTVTQCFENACHILLCSNMMDHLPKSWQWPRGSNVSCPKDTVSNFLFLLLHEEFVCLKAWEFIGDLQIWLICATQLHASNDNPLLHQIILSISHLRFWVLWVGHQATFSQISCCFSTFDRFIKRRR
jgi:hypothetical protein